jgi:hypothetical protein
LAKGVKVTRLHSLPTALLAAREGRKESWPQSCWMMKMRTISPAAGSASATTSQ